MKKRIRVLSSQYNISKLVGVSAQEKYGEEDDELYPTPEEGPAKGKVAKGKKLKKKSKKNKNKNDNDDLLAFEPLQDILEEPTGKKRNKKKKKKNKTKGNVDDEVTENVLVGEPLEENQDSEQVTNLLGEKSTGSSDKKKGQTDSSSDTKKKKKKKKSRKQDEEEEEKEHNRLF
jgi:hypothetical protein